VDILFTAAVADGTAVISGNILRVGGTSGGDVITVDFDAGGGNLQVVINGTPTTLPNAGVTEVRAWGRGGSDDIRLVDWNQNSILKGGAGNDLLLGGGSKDLVFGDAGNDLLYGSSGHDFLVGGDGVDIVFGNNGADILVAGDLACDLTDEVLRDISAGWAIDDESDGGPDDDTIDESVIDTDIDIVIGGFGSDWFIVSAGDIILDWFRRFIDFDDRTIV
jgi:Ca2+-binding RTX toxin-like protein